MANTPDVFFHAIGEELLLLGSNVPGFDASDSIDLLAIDPKGKVTVIDVTGRLTQQQLIRALGHTALVSGWSCEQLLAGVDPAELLNFLRVQPMYVNQGQRVILAASAFDPDALTTARWLQGGHGVDVLCVYIRIIIDALANTEYLDCERVAAAQRRQNLRSPAAAAAKVVKSAALEQCVGLGALAITDADLGGWGIASLSESVMHG